MGIIKDQSYEESFLTKTLITQNNQTIFWQLKIQTNQ
jgi:hypothetical protein